MDEKRAAELINKYKKLKHLVKLFAVLIVIEFIILPAELDVRVYIAFFMTLIMCFLASKINSSVRNIAVKECDPVLFDTVAKGISSVENIVNDIFVAEMVGDYQKGIELSVKKLKSLKKKKIEKLFYLESITKLAFEGGDFELCQKYCREITDLLDSVRLKYEVKKRYIDRVNFYIDFINCDYESALNHLKICMYIPNQQNSYKAVMQYYQGLVYYYSSKGDEARKCFEYVCCHAPKLKIADFSQKYIDALDNGIFKAIETNSYNTEFQADENDTKIQMPVWKKIFLVICAVVLIICGVRIADIDKGTMPEVLTKDTGYELVGSPALFRIDEKYCLCVFETSESNIVTAYLEKCGADQYKMKASYQDRLEGYINDNADYYLHADGKSPKVIFDITDDKNAIPENKTIKEFTTDGKKHYLYYSAEKEKYHYFSSSGINID